MKYVCVTIVGMFLILENATAVENDLSNKPILQSKNEFNDAILDAERGWSRHVNQADQNWEQTLLKAEKQWKNFTSEKGFPSPLGKNKTKRKAIPDYVPSEIEKKLSRNLPNEIPDSSYSLEQEESPNRRNTI